MHESKCLKKGWGGFDTSNVRLDLLVSLLSFHLPCDTTQFVVCSTDFAPCICIVGTFGCRRVNSNLPLGGFASFVLVATLSWGVQNVLVRDFLVACGFGQVAGHVLAP